MIAVAGEDVFATGEAAGDGGVFLLAVFGGGAGGEDDYRSFAKGGMLACLRSADRKIFELAGDGEREFGLNPEDRGHGSFMFGERSEPGARDRAGLLRRAAAEEANQSSSDFSGARGEERGDEPKHADAREDRRAAADFGANAREFAVLIGWRIPLGGRDRIDEDHAGDFFGKAGGKQRHGEA